MGGILYLWRFFRVASPLSSVVVWTFGVLVVGACAVVVTAPARTGGTLAPILLMQMFAASSGFAVPARRGHYDLMLTRTGGRIGIALAHWSMSISPGIASWLIVASVESIIRGRASVATSSGTCLAVFLVSTIPWALNVALPRFSGGIGWLLVLTISGVTLSPDGAAWLMQPSSSLGPWQAAWAFLVFPIAHIGRQLSAEDAVRIVSAVMLAVCAMMAACAWVRGTAFPLEAAQ